MARPWSRARQAVAPGARRDRGTDAMPRDRPVTRRSRQRSGRFGWGSGASRAPEYGAVRCSRPAWRTPRFRHYDGSEPCRRLGQHHGWGLAGTPGTMGRRARGPLARWRVAAQGAGAHQSARRAQLHSSQVAKRILALQRGRHRRQDRLQQQRNQREPAGNAVGASIHGVAHATGAGSTRQCAPSSGRSGASGTRKRRAWRATDHPLPATNALVRSRRRDSPCSTCPSSSDRSADRCCDAPRSPPRARTRRSS